jgi:hypothetical protein
MMMKPPIRGARRGPANTVRTKQTMLIMKISGLNMSLAMAPARVKVQAPKKPAKKRQMKIDCKSFDTAVAKENMLKPNMLIRKGMRRPLSSENGAQTRGPVAKPRTYKEIPSVPTSRDTPYAVVIGGMAAEKILLVNVTTTVDRLMRTKMRSLGF